MKFEANTDTETGDRTFTLRISSIDLRDVNLTNFDALLLSECEKSPKISDKVLALETLVRRIEESLA